MKYSDEVKIIAEREGHNLKVVSINDSHADFRTNTANIPFPKDNLTYYVALHELGHFHVDQKPYWIAEGKAWQWALEHVKEKPNNETKELIAESILEELLMDSKVKF